MSDFSLTSEQVEHQRSLFERGTNYVKVLRPATIDDGILKLNKGMASHYAGIYEQKRKGLKVGKFVPASGAATRMFKDVIAWIDDPESHEESINELFQSVEKFPFFEEWLRQVNELDIETFEVGLESKVRWLEVLVSEPGLNLARLPKALIGFHRYDRLETPLREQLREAMHYANNDGKCCIHFTVSEEHQGEIKSSIDELKQREPFSQVEWDITYSFQEKNTNTIAVDIQNKLVQRDGELMQRPGGHGSLLVNLDRLESDIIFVKNIDNVAREESLADGVLYKKALGGVLLHLREDLRILQDQMNKGLVDENEIRWIREKWGLRIPKAFKPLRDYLKRPIRVCGMVRNQGEPGGGPFWCADAFLGESLQIVEQSQIDKSIVDQSLILKSSTHFNPVDLVCCTRDLKGNAINLHDYSNKDLYFIANKSAGNEPIKALEWPGLWNGAMTNWITLFVEVPAKTFNPVKVVQDLLRPPHQESV